MLGGRITERHIREAADPVPLPADSATGTDGGPQTGRPPAVRPAALEGLARPPVSASPAVSMAAMTLRRAELLPRARSAQTLQTPQGRALTTALKYAALWRTLIGDASIDTEKRLDLAKRGAESARKGIKTLTDLPKNSLTNAGELMGELLDHLAEAATAGIKAYHRLLNEEWNARPERRGIGSENAPASSVYDGLREVLTREPLKGAVGGLRRFRIDLDLIVLLGNPAKPADPLAARLERHLPAVMSGKAHCRSAMQSADALNITLCAYSLGKIALMMGLPELTERVQALLDAMKYRHGEVTTAVRVLDALAMWYPGAEGAPPDRPTRQQLAGHKALIRAFRDGIDRVGTHLCMDAAARIEMDDTTPLWKSLLDVAEVIGRYRGYLDELYESVRGADPEPAAMPVRVPQPEASSSTPEPAGSADAADAADAVVRTEDRNPPEPVGPLAAEPLALANAGVPLQPDTRTVAQKHADRLLKRCQVDAETAAWFRGDVIAIADALGKDTRDIERLMNDRKQSAFVVATSIRQAAEGWFEKREHLERARSALSAEDPRAEWLADRLRALDRIGRYVDAWEADAAKCALLPKEKHLERLLEMGEIERVDAPVWLRPDQAGRSRDRVFEIRIQPKRLSNSDEDADPADGTSRTGDRALPLFVHLHTSRPVDADKLHTLRYRDFDAVHLKLAAQRNQGRNWEKMMHALGHPDAKVERAKLCDGLLRRLFALAGRDDASGPAAAGPSAAQ